MNPLGRFIVPSDATCLDGHFPGRPTVPGVVLLDEVAALLESRFAGSLAEILVCKFTIPVLPGQIVEIACDDRPADGRIGFACSVAGETVAQGTLRLSIATA